MEEKAVVCASQKDFAQVQVELKGEICPTCSARSLCVGQQEEKGTITVLNPLSARPGDEVKIEIPEGDYTKELIRLFGILLIGSILGLALGYLLALFLSLPPTPISLLGFLLGLLSGGFILFRQFGRAKKNKLYPVIVDIIRKGDSHG
jgi:positive regulator of sigma E activity